MSRFLSRAAWAAALASCVLAMAVYIGAAATRIIDNRVLRPVSK